MFEVEFETQVKNGVIEIPEEYKSKVPEGINIKVTLTIEKQKQHRKSIMDELAKNPISVKGWTKLTRDEIYDRKL